jgi:hypothetical protein
MKNGNPFQAIITLEEYLAKSSSSTAYFILLILNIIGFLLLNSLFVILRIVINPNLYAVPLEEVVGRNLTIFISGCIGIIKYGVPVFLWVKLIRWTKIIVSKKNSPSIDSQSNSIEIESDDIKNSSQEERLISQTHGQTTSINTHTDNDTPREVLENSDNLLNVTLENQPDSNNQYPTEIFNPKKTTLIILIGILLNMILSGENMLLNYLSNTSPGGAFHGERAFGEICYALYGTFAYSAGGMIFAVIFITPIFYYRTSKGWPNLAISVSKSLLIGAVLRAVSYFIPAG